MNAPQYRREPCGGGPAGVSPANPFADAIVANAWTAPEADVPDIHREVSDLCLNAVAEARRDGRPRSILVHGSAGSGKTHLLARLRSALAAEQEPPVFCYVRLATAPNLIRRHLRRCLVQDLVRTDGEGVTQLDQVLLGCLDRHTGQPVGGPLPIPERLAALRAGPAEIDRAREAVSEIVRRLELDYKLARACGFWLIHRHRAEISEWLASGDLSEVLHKAIRFQSSTSHDSGDCPERDAAAIIGQLARLVTATRPLVLCFDQMEALQTSPGDSQGFFALGSLVSDLHDLRLPIVFVTCGLTPLLPDLKTAIPGSSYDRLAHYEKVLAGLSEPEARALMHSRLDRWTVGNRSDRPSDPLWPLSEAAFARFMADGDRTPRRLFGLCRDALPRVSRPRVSTGAGLMEQFELRREAAAGRLADSHGTFVHGLAQLAAAKGRFGVTTPANRRDVDLVCTLQGRSLVIGVCNQQGNSLTARLRRIRAEPPAAGEERIVVRDSDRPIPRSAAKAREHWQAIAAAGEPLAAPRLRALMVSAEALAALEAIRALLSDARAGDLVHDGQTVPPQTVEAWIRNELLDESLERLLAELEHGAAEASAGPLPDAGLRDAALEIVQSRGLVGLEELAAAVGRDPPAVIEVVTAADGVFGVLGSPVQVVYQRLAGPAREDDDAG